MPHGSPVVVTNMRGDVAAYGRVVAQKGGVIEVMSPHGTVLRSGLLWVRSVTPDERRKLRQFERYTRDEGRALYQAKFSLDLQAEWGTD